MVASTSTSHRSASARNCCRLNGPQSGSTELGKIRVRMRTRTRPEARSTVELERHHGDVVEELLALHLVNRLEGAVDDAARAVRRVADEAVEQLHAHAVARPVERLDEAVGHGDD